MSAAELARRAGVARSTVVELENGRRASPQPSKLRAILDVLGLPPEVMVGKGEDMPSREVLLQRVAVAASVINDSVLHRAVVPMLATLARETPTGEEPASHLVVEAMPTDDNGPGE